MNLKLKYFFSAVLMLMFFQLQAQVQFAISVDVKEIGRKDELQVQYVISGASNVMNFQPPLFEGWNLIAGPRIMSESYNINGKATALTKYIYFLSPKSTGKLKLPTTSVEVNNKALHCSELEINVKKQDHVNGVPAPGSYSGLTFQGDANLQDNSADDLSKDHVLKKGEDAVKKIRDNLFIIVTTNKKKVYVGEPVLVEYKLYTRLKSVSRVIKQPEFNGCSVHEMTTEDNGQIEMLKGRKFTCYTFRRVQLMPLQEGLLTIGQTTLENDITFLNKESDYRSLFYDEPAGKVETVTMKSDPLNVEVVALPKEANRVAVGKYTISAKLNKASSAVNEQNTIIVTIEGAGNFRTISEPEIRLPDGFYRFDATEKDEVDKLSFPLAGKRVYEIPFEASAAGEADIPPVSFSYFDPAKGKVQTLQSNALHLTVTPAVKKQLQQSVASVKGANNINLLLIIVPVLFAGGAVIIWRRSKQQQVETVTTPATVLPVVPVIPSYDAQQRYNDLLLIQGDAEFYIRARQFAQQTLNVGVGSQQLLQQVITDCNTMLYTPLPTTSKKEILDKLQQAIA